MKGKTKITFAVIPVAVSAIALSLVLINSKKNFTKMTADPSVYSLTLDSSAAASGLTASFQKTVDAPFTTARGSVINFKLTNAKAYAGEGSGYVTLGNYGTVYCCTSDEHHVSGIATVKVTYSSGQLVVLGTNAKTDDGAAYITNGAVLTSGVEVDYSINPLNAIIIRAGEASVNIQKIEIGYTCSENNQSFDYNKVYNVENFESYTQTGVGYDNYNGGHGMGISTGLRSQYYSVYYGAGSDPLSGKGWQIMGSADYLTYHATAGRDGSKTALFKSNANNYFEYVQAKHFFGVPNAIGKGAKLSAWIHGAYADTNGTAGASATVTLIAYYNKMLKLGDGTTNEAATATYTIAGSEDWKEYTVTLDPTKTVYAFGIHIAKASATLYLPVDDVKIYTESPYPTNPVTGVELNKSATLLGLAERKPLVATVSPADAGDKSLTWTSSNESAVTVDQNGYITAVAAGTSTITVTTTDGGFTDTCAVTVKELPGGTYFTTLPLSGDKTFNVEVVMSTRTEVKVWFYGMAPSGAELTAYDAATGAFTVKLDGTVTIANTEYTFGDLTGNVNNNQLENVGLSGTVGGLLGSANGHLTIPQPTNYYWNCDGTDAELQNVFRRRWRDGNSWSYDDSNSNRIQASPLYKASGTSGVGIRPYAAGVGLVLKTAVTDGIPVATCNTFCAWIYNPSTSAVNFRFFLYKNAELTSNFEPMGTKTIPAQSWYYLRIGYGANTQAGTVYNFMITNLGSNSGVTFVVDDIWFHN